MKATLVLCLAATVVSMSVSVVAFAQESVETRVTRLENRADRLESRISKAASLGAVLFLYGAFCALWAQNSGRNAWGWFFLGAAFSVLAVIALLSQHSADRKRLASHE